LFYKIKNVKLLIDYRLSVDFICGEKKIYDLTPLFNKWSEFRTLKEVSGLFQHVKVDKGGYGVSWNDEIDLDCNELYHNGTTDEEQLLAIAEGNAGVKM